MKTLIRITTNWKQHRKKQISWQSYAQKVEQFTSYKLQSNFMKGPTSILPRPLHPNHFWTFGKFYSLWRTNNSHPSIVYVLCFHVSNLSKSTQNMLLEEAVLEVSNMPHASLQSSQASAILVVTRAGSVRFMVRWCYSPLYWIQNVTQVIEFRFSNTDHLFSRYQIPFTQHRIRIFRMNISSLDKWDKSKQ